MDALYEKLADAIEKSNKAYDIPRIRAAYELAKKAHEGQMRSSGDPYISHPIEVAVILVGLGMDSDTIIGGLLHDIGTYRVFKHDGSDGEPLKFSKKRYILHGLKGYEYLLDEGVDESIAQFCRNHTGVGLTREDVVRQELPLPPADYVPMNLEQEVVMYADKFHSKSVPPKFLQVEAYTARAERFGGENKQRWLDLVAKYGVPDIPALAEKYGMRMI